MCDIKKKHKYPETSWNINAKGDNYYAVFEIQGAHCSIADHVILILQYWLGRGITHIHQQDTLRLTWKSQLLDHLLWKQGLITSILYERLKPYAFTSNNWKKNTFLTKSIQIQELPE